MTKYITREAECEKKEEKKELHVTEKQSHESWVQFNQHVKNKT